MVRPACYEGLLNDLADPESAPSTMRPLEKPETVDEALSDIPSDEEVRSKHENGESPAARPGNDPLSPDSVKSAPATRP